MLNKTHIPNTVIDKLLGEGFFTHDKQKVLRLIKNSDKQNLIEILINDFKYDRHTVYQALCRIYAFREISLDADSVSENWIKYIQNFYQSLDSRVQKQFINYRLVPFGYNEKNKEIRIFLTPDPIDRDVEQVIKQAGINKFELAYSQLEQVDILLQRAMSAENQFLEYVKEITDQVSFIEDEQDQDDNSFDEEELSAAINKSVLVNLFEGCLIEAVRKGASDIHIIPKEGNITEYYFRINGRLNLWYKQEGVKPEGMLAVVKDRTKNVDRFEWESAQDGYIQREIDKALIRFRVSILPVVSSAYTRKYESVVIRVLDDRKVITDLEKLGFNGYAKDEFVKAINKPQGMIILTGPTGSGKSTTLMAALHQVMTSELNILTVEDPVEYNIKGARQLKINNKMNFDQALRSILRHDPDIVMVGEIRDAKTAEIAIKLANTGHLTFSTLHTNDAASVLSRLYKMNIEPFLISYAINLVVAQRLIRVVCNNCRKPITKQDASIPLSLGFTEKEMKKTTFYQATGCDECGNGYKSRTAIHEVLPFTNEIRQLILQASDELDEDAIRKSAIKNGMTTLRQAARKLAIEGRTTLQEVVAVTTD